MHHAADDTDVERADGLQPDKENSQPNSGASLEPLIRHLARRAAAEAFRAASEEAMAADRESRFPEQDLVDGGRPPRSAADE